MLEVVGFGYWVLGDSAADQTHYPLPTTHALKAHRPPLEDLGLVLEAVGFGYWVLGDSAADQTHHPLPTTHALKPIAHSERLWA